ncbi:MAG TPA: tetratricopeptide repeat protein [Kofleriaceae bacterium]|nr:tetratricopeptide repeat protein [Kofleriaceae bacterium]
MRGLLHRVSFILIALGSFHVADSVLRPTPAFADAKSKKEIETKMKEAMENYDLLEYEEARKILNQALTVAKKAKMESDPVTAKVHLRLGIVYFAGLQDSESAKLSFLNAAEIDKSIALDKAYSTPEMVKLLEEAKSEAGGTGGGGGGGGDVEPPSGAGGGDVDCSTVTGVQHTIVDTAKGGKDLILDAAVGSDVQPAKVVIMYRARGATDFSESKMVASGCVYKGIVPKAAMAGDLIHYYVAAYNDQGRVIASKGSAGSPNIVEVAGGGGGGNLALDEENPLGGGGGGGDEIKRGGGGGGGGERDLGAVVTPKGKKTLFIALVGGSGGGYVTGETEQAANDVKCCFAPQLLHVQPEIGYYLNKTTTVSLVARLGFPVGANIAGHSPVAPAGLIKVRKALSTTGTGLVVSGGVGGGVIRDTIKLDGAAEGMDVDVVAIGPLFVSGGAGYSAGLGGGLSLIAEMNAVAGIPVVSKLGNSILNFGVQLDFNLGLHIGF